MNPLTMGLIGGGASLLGSIFSSATSASNTQEQIQASEAEQATQNAFTEQMSNTAYQRASKDMTAAGLNPAMMFGSGSAASTPSGSSIQAPMPQTTSPMAGLGQAADKIVSTAVQAKTFDKLTEEIGNLQADRANTDARTLTELKRPQEVATRTSAIDADRRLTEMRRDNEEIDKQVHGNEATRALHEREMREANPWIDKMALGGRTAKAVVDPIAELASSATGVGRLFNDRWRDRSGTFSDTRYGKGYSSTETWRQ